MLENTIIRKIEDFVYLKPRSIQEIANHIGKNWRTADRYIQTIEKEFGTISTRTFREGTRGALKIVYWASVEKISNSVFQEKLEEEIIHSKRKEDFSAFDIFQHISNKNKKVIIEKVKDENLTNLKELAELLEKTEKQLLVFSGNLSFINLEKGDLNIFNSLEKLIKKDVKIKVICRVDIAGKENIEKLLSLSFKHKKDLIDIRHTKQPLRGFISDNKLIRLKEISEPTGKIKEMEKRVFIFYTLKDKEWAEWLSRIFWKIFNKSVSSEKRLQEINKIIL